MPLVDVRGFNITPDVVGSFGRGFGVGAGIRRTRQEEEARQAEIARQQELQGLLGQLGPGGIAPQQPGLQVPPGATPPIVPQAAGPGRQPVQPTGNRSQALAQLAVQFPKRFDEVFKNIGAIDERSRDEAARSAFEISRADPTQRPALIQRRAAEIRARGGDPSDTLGLLQMPTNQQDLALETLQIAALNPQQRLEVSKGTPLPAIQGLTEAAGGGFIGVDPTTREAVYIPPAEGKISAAQAKSRREAQEKQAVAQEKRAEKDLAKAEKALEADVKAEKEQFDKASKLRKELDTASKDFNKIESAFGRIEAVADDPSAAGDLALIFNFMKMLDPGSTVREGEFATAQNAAGVGQRIQAQYNNILRGERMVEEQRKDFLSQSKNIFARSKSDNKKVVDKIVSIGKRFDIPKEDILGEAAAVDVKTLTDEELQAEAERLRAQ